MEKFEPIRDWPIRLIWKKKSKLPRSVNALILLIAKYHEYDEQELKYLCKKNLSYNKKEDHKGTKKMIQLMPKVIERLGTL